MGPMKPLTDDNGPVLEGGAVWQRESLEEVAPVQADCFLKEADSLFVSLFAAD